ncbi:MAG: acetate--CoA ligase family protein [Proteobacteria bacterium]|nr:acetate--CoA ligase family protein [Pseudomonadota bacterium]MDA0994465.1 acetate--CoA ligase family protein [Pseudomonadota bacterium]
MSRARALMRLLTPGSIAVIGGESAAEVIRQCKAIGFGGELWAVNPGRKELAGVPCVASVNDLPSVPDASFIAAPPEASLQIVRELSALGAPGAVCFAAGFAEIGDDGAGLQRRLRDAAGHMAVIGPNCHGYLNYLDGVALWPDQHGGNRVDRGVALISQSGNIAINLTMQQRGLDYGYVISVGNNSTLGIHDYIDALLMDPRVTAIGLHIEGIDDVAAFSSAAIRALHQGIPIVALKTGRSSRGAEITLSHTGSLSGSDKLYTALFKRVGIARCDSLSQFVETLKFLSLVGPLADDTIGSMSCSGGDASLVADCAEALHLSTPSFSDHSAATLQKLLGPNVHISNPLDYHLYVWGNYDKLRDCFAEVLNNQFACTLLVLDYPPGDGDRTANWEIAERALVGAVAATGRHAVIVSSLPETMPQSARNRLKAAGIAPMQGIDDCLYAIRAAAFIGRAQRNVEIVLPVMAAAGYDGPATALDEWDSKQELVGCGLEVPDGRLCSALEVLDAAETLGYPLVLKAVSSELAHKSEAGAVAINLGSSEAVAAALHRMSDRFDRFLIEKMVGPTVVEMIVGVSRDRTFGLTMLIGVGGTLVELLDDTVPVLLPAQRHEIDVAIGSLKANRLLAGFRTQLAGDRQALLDAIEAIGRYAVQHHDSLLELDVNPLLVLPKGVVAVDAFIRRRSDEDQATQ